MKGRAVMERVQEMAVRAVVAGEMDEGEARLLIEDLGDVVQVYIVGGEMLRRMRVAKLAWERDGVDRRMVRP